MGKSATAAVPAKEPSTEKPAPAANTTQRAVSVIKSMKLGEHVARAVLAEQGLTPTSMVDPAEFRKSVDRWLKAPAGK